jgi:hypothetical protein
VASQSLGGRTLSPIVGRGARVVIALAVVVGTAALLSLGTASADLLRSTSTSLSCPAIVAVGGQTATCTANVTDTGTGTATTPTGVVEFSATNSHGVADRATCTLSSGSCGFTHIGWSNLGTKTIAATYEGDSSHAGSSGTQDIQVISPPIPPPAHCHVPSVKGERLAVAKKALRRSFCNSGTIERAFSKRVAKGRVVSARPGHGKFLPFHAKIRLVVSKGKPHARP